MIQNSSSLSDKPRRRNSAEREQQIIDAAVQYFATHGFSGSTRNLAKALGIAQPLLYRYFPSKQALIERIYDELYTGRWNPFWEDLLRDRSKPFDVRLKEYCLDYARRILQRDWIRIFIFAALDESGIHARYLDMLHRKIFVPIFEEMAHAYGILPSRAAALREEALELIWGWHSSIFYLGVRQWVYGLPVHRDLDHLIEKRVQVFLGGIPGALFGDASATDDR